MYIIQTIQLTNCISSAYISFGHSENEVYFIFILSENLAGGTYTDEKLSSAAGSIEKDTVIDGSVSSEEEGNKHVAIDGKWAKWRNEMKNMWCTVLINSWKFRE